MRRLYHPLWPIGSQEQTLPTGVFRFLFQPTTAPFLKFVKNWKPFVCLNSNRASKGWVSHLIRPKWDFRFAMSKFLLRALTPVQLMPAFRWWRDTIPGELRFTRQRAFSWMLPRSMTGLPGGRDSRFDTKPAS